MAKMSEMETEIHNLLRQIQGDQHVVKGMIKESERNSASDKTETMHSPTKSSEAREVPMTHLMNENFSYDSS